MAGNSVFKRPSGYHQYEKAWLAAFYVNKQAQTNAQAQTRQKDLWDQAQNQKLASIQKLSATAQSRPEELSWSRVQG